MFVFLILAGFTAGLAIIAWQSLTIHNLRGDEAGLRRDLRTVLATVSDAPTNQLSGEDLTRAERLELMKLRYEVRDLKEREAESHSDVPKSGLRAAVADLLRPASSPSGPFKFRSEWQAPGFQSLATNVYAVAMQTLAKSTNDFARFLALPRAAKMSLAVGRAEDARRFAEDALVLNDKFAAGDPQKANGDVTHDANLVLGCLSLDQGRVEEAKRRLIAAGKTGGSTTLDGPGPNMSLAKELLAKGGQETVLQYFDLCRKFWTTGGEKLDQWTKDIEAGRVPDFGANLLY